MGRLIARHISCHGVNVTSVARNDERNHVVGSSSAGFASMEIHARTCTHTHTTESHRCHRFEDGERESLI